uniref:CCHC-type domain-containing protein n=1 Tax=Tanacetum cinerariifolium TaxID=118510 RepID=A0A6L2KRQ4_TANCI|nr:hypothetical protein [Tanacetum cinerariifolium]
MHKAFPLRVIEFPLPEEVPTASEESCHCQKKREASAMKIALLLKIQQYLQHEHYALWEVIEFGDSYEVPATATSVTPIGTVSDETGKKKGRTVTVTADDIQKRKNDVKARTTLLLSLPDEHQLRFTKHNRGNEDVNTSSVSTASINVPTASANIGVIDDDDMEEIDIKWNIALLSMRDDKFWKKTGKKISIQGTNVAGFDKSKVECFNCHKMGHFARECRAPTSQDRGRRDNYRQGSKFKEQAPKALMAIDRVGWDWSYMANDEENHALVAKKEAPTEFALMANTSAERLAQVESRLAAHRDREIKYCEKIRGLEYKTEKRVKKGTSRSHNNTHKSFTPRPVVHKPYRPLMRPMRSNMNGARPNRTSFNKSTHSYTNRPFQRTSVGSSQNNIDDKGYWDSGCSRHMTRNISYLSDYEPFDGGYVSFGQGGCKITGKGSIKTVDAGTNSSNLLGTKDAASQEVKKDVSSLRYIALPNWVHDALLESSSSKPQDDCGTDVPKSSGNFNPTATLINPPADQLETLTVETLIPTVSSPVPTACFTNSLEPSSDTRLISKRVTNQVETPSLDNILALTNWFEDILGVTTDSVDSDRVEADVSNMETTITASLTSTLRIHKDHPKSQIIGPVDTPIQTKNKSKENISDALQDPSWVEAMLEGLLQFKIQNVWTLVDCPKGPPGFQDPKFLAKVYKVEKALYGLHQAPRAWYGTLSKYLLTNGFQRGTIDQTLFIRRQRGDFILKEDGIFLSQDKYVGDILKKFGYSDVRSSNTPMDKENPWDKDGTRKDVDLHLYRSMIGSFMYLTTSRPDIMFAVYACARHQVTPKECHLHAVKRIFRYLKGHPKLGLWYPKESHFDLVAYSDSDYGGATQDRKSTTGGC